MKSYSYVNSSGFRGYKRTWVTNHGDEKAQEGLNAIYGKDLKKAPVVLTPFRYNMDTCVGIDVSVDGYHIGNFYANDEKSEMLLDAILSGKVSSVHIRIEQKYFDKRYEVNMFLKVTE